MEISRNSLVSGSLRAWTGDASGEAATRLDESAASHSSFVNQIAALVCNPKHLRLLTGHACGTIAAFAFILVEILKLICIYK